MKPVFLSISQGPRFQLQDCRQGPVLVSYKFPSRRDPPADKSEWPVVPHDYSFLLLLAYPDLLFQWAVFAQYQARTPEERQMFKTAARTRLGICLEIEAVLKQYDVYKKTRSWIEKYSEYESMRRVATPDSGRSTPSYGRPYRRFTPAGVDSLARKRRSTSPKNSQDVERAENNAGESSDVPTQGSWFTQCFSCVD